MSKSNAAVALAAVAIVLTQPVIRKKAARALHKLAQFLDPAPVSPVKPVAPPPMWSKDEPDHEKQEQLIKEYIEAFDKAREEQEQLEELPDPLEENLKSIRNNKKISLKDFQQSD